MALFPAAKYANIALEQNVYFNYIQAKQHVKPKLQPLEPIELDDRVPV